MSFSLKCTLLFWIFLGSRWQLKGQSVIIELVWFFLLFSSVSKPKGKKAKDTKKSVRVPAEPQTVVSPNNIDSFSVDLVV